METSQNCVNPSDINIDFIQFNSLRKLNLEFSKLEKITDKWGYFRQLYMEIMPDIIEISMKNINQWAGIYNLDWYSVFTPIEKDAWNSIREHGDVVLYPQFPIFNYFIDFANPYLRIGLEIDGKTYHDGLKDRYRDVFLNKYGWTIFRISREETLNPYCSIFEIQENDDDESDNLLKITDWLLNTCDGVIFAIKYHFFLDSNRREFYRNNVFKNYDYCKIEDLLKRTLQEHCNVKLFFN